MTKKTLDESSIVNELTGQSAFFQKPQSPSPINAKPTSELFTLMENRPPITTPPSKESTPKITSEPKPQVPNFNPPNPLPLPSQPTSVSASQLISQSTSQSTDQSTNRSTNQAVDNSPILGRPKSFYISQKQNEDLDTAVRKLSRKIGERLHQKIDRSTLLRLLLEESDITNDRTINRLASRLASRLISQLTGK